MYCSQCATPLSPNDVYCPTCAKPLASFAFNVADVAQVEPLETPTVVRADPAPPKAPASTRRWLFATLGGVSIFGLIVTSGVIGLAAIYFLFLKPSNENGFGSQRQGEIARNDSVPKRTPSPIPTPLPTAEPTPPPVKALIVDQMFAVPAGQVQSVTINASTAGTIQGGFVAYEGGKDIDVFVVDGANLSLLTSGSQFRYLYQRLKVERGKIDVPVVAGTYYVVFSNRHALLTRKTVAAEIYFEN